MQLYRPISTIIVETASVDLWDLR